MGMYISFSFILEIIKALEVWLWRS